MTFLQPFVLWGLPLILLPIIIHLINRMRHRPQQWAAMRFLLSAKRHSVSQAKLRQWLILLFRVLAVLALVLFLSRPLAGGWIGWVLAPAPDAIVLLLDRSASMETKPAGSDQSSRQLALDSFARAAQDFEERSHLVLIDSAIRSPQPLSKAANLLDLPATEATDTAADIPALFQSALRWLIENRAGTAELWIASDLQRSNWRPEDPRWKDIVSEMSALPQQVRIRLLAFPQPNELNTSISIQELIRRLRSGSSELHLTADLQRNVPLSDATPLTIALDDARSQIDVTMESLALRWRHKLNLGDKKSGGWGALQLPADANLRDNTAYFVYGPQTPARAAIVAKDKSILPPLSWAASSLGTENREPAQVLSRAEIETAPWDTYAMIVWQDQLPTGPLVDRLRSFAEEGGILFFLPPGDTDSQRFAGLGWGEIQNADPETPFAIVRWDEDQGPLAKTDEGFSLPIPDTLFQRRQTILGSQTALAAFADGYPFLVRQNLGQGEIYFCSSLPNLAWSTLGEGPVLVPMLQRLLLSGTRRLQRTGTLPAGQLAAGDAKLSWTSIDSTEPKDIRIHAGVFKSGDRILALNRPPAEEDPDFLDPDSARNLFGALPMTIFEERRNRMEALQGEFWRVFLFGMLLFLIVESLLILPTPTAPAKSNFNPNPKPGKVTPKPAATAGAQEVRS